jgi:hypothetical protein
MIPRPFNPHYGANQTVSPAAASATILVPKGTNAVRFVNRGAVACYVRITDQASTATAADTPIAGNSEIILYKNTNHQRVSHIEPGGAGTTLEVQPGNGGV